MAKGVHHITCYKVFLKSALLKFFVSFPFINSFHISFSIDFCRIFI
nr:MAG TPA: hypothetical protein [Caudoviricetes sp.]